MFWLPWWGIVSGFFLRYSFYGPVELYVGLESPCFWQIFDYDCLAKWPTVERVSLASNPISFKFASSYKLFPSLKTLAGLDADLCHCYAIRTMYFASRRMSIDCIKVSVKISNRKNALMTKPALRDPANRQRCFLTRAQGERRVVYFEPTVRLRHLFKCDLNKERHFVIGR